MVEAPHAPWALRGEVLVAVVRGGPRFVYGVRYTESPVGPFFELGVADFARLGLRPGLRTTVLVVSDLSVRAQRLPARAPSPSPR